MPDLLRCFIAVKIPSTEALRRVLKELAEMGRPLRVVDPDNLHVTLKFLGDTDRSLISEIGSILDRISAGESPCILSVVGLGVFPHAQRPNVVWVGLKGAEALSRMAFELESALEPLGFARESRPFVPHLTLARVKARPPQSLHDLLTRDAKTAFGTAAIDHVELVRSELASDGARHTVLAVSVLGAKS